MSRLPDQLETSRLLLRPVVPDDLAFLTELHQDPEVTRYLGGDGSPRPPAKTREWLEQTLAWYASDGAGQYLVVRKSDGAPLGRAGYGCFEIERTASGVDGYPLATFGPGSAAPKSETWSILEIGYTLAREAWGSGYASEAARRWMQHAFEERDAPIVHSVIHPENAGSIRVAEKNGLVATGPDIRMEGRVYGLYGLTAEAWRARASAAR